MPYSDVIGLPITYRKWFLNRLAEEFKKSNELRNTRQAERFEPSPARSDDLPMGELNREAKRMAVRAEKKFK